jgi:3,4-dihydroxy-2-butanone 4-phosphate synthase
LFATVERAIAAIGAGQMVIVVDAADREDEGDLVMAAQYVGARDVHFMAVEGRGLVCVPMTAGRLAALRIDPMVARNTDPVGTAFHVSVDVRAGTTTGISASIGQRRFVRWPTRIRGPNTSPVRGTYFRWPPVRVACSSAPGTPKPPSIW